MRKQSLEIIGLNLIVLNITNRVVKNHDFFTEKSKNQIKFSLYKVFLFFDSLILLNLFLFILIKYFL